VKVPRDITLKEVNRIFGPIVNRNGSNYLHNKDPHFICKVKTLWIVHQKPYFLASKFIPLCMLQRLMFEKVHGKNMNWALYANWTNNEHHWCKARAEQIEFLSDEDEGEASLEYKV